MTEFGGAGKSGWGASNFNKVDGLNYIFTRLAVRGFFTGTGREAVDTEIREVPEWCASRWEKSSISANIISATELVADPSSDLSLQQRRVTRRSHDKCLQKRNYSFGNSDIG